MQKLDGQLITVLGGGGFVGRYVVQQLLSDGARVRIAQRNPQQATFLRPLGGLGQTQFVRANVCDYASVARAIQGSDGVINLVGSFDNMQAVQGEGAANVAKAVKAAGITALVHMSAIGAASSSESAYGRSKGDGEVAVRAAFPDAVILRPSIIFGREDQFINRFANMVQGCTVPVVSGETRFQPVYVGDVAAAAVAALAPAFAGKLFELAGPQTFSMGELVRWLADFTGNKPCFVNVPTGLAGLIAALPFTPISKDQLKMLKDDNVAAAGSLGLTDLGITPTALAALADDWLVLYREKGRFAEKNRAA